MATVRLFNPAIFNSRIFNTLEQEVGLPGIIAQLTVNYRAYRPVTIACREKFRTTQETKRKYPITINTEGV